MTLSKATAARIFALLFTVLLVGGCSNSSSDALEADANGYQCSKCKAKFYTDKNVWAEFCPSCKASGPSRISALVCLKDKYSIIPEATVPGVAAETAKCQKCGASLEAVRLPLASELQAWGAAKKTQKEVCAN